ALMSAPRILLVDEPSVGLSPLLVQHTVTMIKELKDGFNLTVLMAEQNFQQAIRIADRGYIIVHGEIVFEGRNAEALRNNDLVRCPRPGAQAASSSRPGEPTLPQRRQDLPRREGLRRPPRADRRERVVDRVHACARRAGGARLAGTFRAELRLFRRRLDVRA